MKKPKLPPMPEVAPAPTPAQSPTMASPAGNPTGAFNSPSSRGFLGGGMMMNAIRTFGKQRAGRKSLIGG